MSARAMWKAELTLGETKIPTKLYAAVQDAKIHFRLLHANDHTPVKQQMVDPETGEPVAPTDIKKAVEVDRGTFVLLSDQEQAALQPKPSRQISVEQVVDAADVDERWFDRPYYLGPDGDEEGYFALADVLAKRNEVGIAHWVLRNKRYVGALHASGGYLLLETLRYAQDMVQVGSVRPRSDREPDKRELALAEQLISTLEDRFDPQDFHDEYREKVEALLEAKAKGKVVRFPKPAKRKDSGSLIESLQASLKAGKKRAASGR